MGAFFGVLEAQGGGGTGGFAGAAISANVSAGIHNDFDPGGAPTWPGTASAPYGRLFLALAADAELTGLKAGIDGQQLQLNVAGGNLQLDGSNGGSTPIDRFLIGFSSIVIPDGASITMIYTAGTLNKWVVSQ